MARTATVDNVSAKAFCDQIQVVHMNSLNAEQQRFEMAASSVAVGSDVRQCLSHGG